MSSCTKQLFCAPCSRKFETEEEFNEHLKSHLTRNRSSTFMTYIQPHECVVCHRRFDIKSHLELHYNTHILNPDTICPFCGLDCSSIVGLEVHARQCSEIFLKTGCNNNLDETNSSDSNTTEPSCGQLEVRNQLFGKTVESDDMQKLNESQIKLLALIATAASFTQEDKSMIQESLEKSTDNSYGGLFNGKESKAYKTYLKASYRYGMPKPNNYVNVFPCSVIKYSQKKKQVSTISGGFREKSYSCEYCSEKFSRKCVLDMHMQKHLLEEKNKLDHFDFSKTSKPSACKTTFTDNKQKFITSSTDVFNNLTEQSKNETKNLPKTLSNVLPRMHLPCKNSVVLKSEITKKVPFLKSSEIYKVSEEPVALIKSLEQDKNKTKYKSKNSSNISTSRKRLPRKNFVEQNRYISNIISKNTSKKPIPRIRLSCKNYIDQDENKKMNIPKSDINKFIPRMRLPRKCSSKVLKLKTSHMALASKNNRALEKPVPVKPGKNLKLKLSLVRRNALAIKLKIKKYSKAKSYNLRKRNKNEVGKELHDVKPNCPTKKRKRNSELKFKCDVCKKGFNDSFKVRRHYVQHTGEKPYSCSMCEKRFTRTDHLKRHSRICGKRKRAKK